MPYFPAPAAAPKTAPGVRWLGAHSANPATNNPFSAGGQSSGIIDLKTGMTIDDNSSGLAAIDGNFWVEVLKAPAAGKKSLWVFEMALQLKTTAAPTIANGMAFYLSNLTGYWGETPHYSPAQMFSANGSNAYTLTARLITPPLWLNQGDEMALHYIMNLPATNNLNWGWSLTLLSNQPGS